MIEKIHIWVGNFESKASFEKYFDQEPYFKAWYIYDNEPPTGNEEEDKEPSAALRCQFCKEIGIDNYDEDFIMLKYYQKHQSIHAILNDVPGDGSEFLKLGEELGLDRINVLIAYENTDLTQESASKAEKLTYLGQINNLSTSDDKTDLNKHYLWIGKNEISSNVLDSLKNKDVDKERIAKILGIDAQIIKEINFYYTENKEKVDEIIITHVEDYNIAEKMILKADKLAINSTTNLMLELISHQDLKIDINDKLGLSYIGDFQEE
ncbi:immunity 22 family protein [Pedobacter roseus]|uniref:Immunity 22 family protein n=1 Tax=Pedobacter roseus TaxID=336820 RepID=A0A7G9QF55_9SPHI|nr:immunity 22 family protein [Pedobacter roseus]QNN41980.1 immunity 22 family protein [Pedobacter roseus]